MVRGCLHIWVTSICTRGLVDPGLYIGCCIVVVAQNSISSRMTVSVVVERAIENGW